VRAWSHQAVVAVAASSKGAALLTAGGYATLPFPRDAPGAARVAHGMVRHHECVGLGGSRLAGAAWALDGNGLLLSKRVGALRMSVAVGYLLPNLKSLI
jgi:hypothetical protein